MDNFARTAALAAVAMVAAGTALAGAPDYALFESPAKEHRPETWFHLIGGNVSREGLDADLDAIASAGIRGIHLFHGRSNTGVWPGVTNPVECLSRDWDDLIRYAADACEKRGLSFKMQNCPGWSMSGGPWITPENAMRNLTYSRTDFDGGRKIRASLPLPRSPEPDVKIADADRDYRDLFVLAFPTPDGDAPEPYAPQPAEKTDKDGVMRLVYRFAEPVAFRSIELPSPSQMNHSWCYVPEVRFRVNGGAWRDVPQGCWQDRVPMTFALPEAAPATEWTVEIAHKHPLKVDRVRFTTGARLDNWEGKAAWVLRGLDLDAAPAVASGAIGEGDVLDITDKFRDGELDWEAPTGKWTVLRIGHVNNGKKNAPAPPEATGWECSKADVQGIDAHFAGYIGRLANGHLAGGKLKGFIVDSWECCRQTWSRDMEKEFLSARGYAVRKLLPAVFGWIVGSRERTELFLRDWRKTIGELVERNYYGRMSELARQNGLTAQYETGFGDVFPGDIMAFWRHCEEPMCEFWFPRTEAFVGQDDFKPILPCASAAHAYGKRRVAAEAFTTMDLRWDETPLRLKACANHAFVRGVTHLVFHTYTHNPQVGFLPPGSSFGRKIGTPFLRGQAWWGAMPDFTAWAARCETMLEAGLPANDVLWYLGETVGHKPSEKSPFPKGFKYDYANPDALLSRISVKDGVFATPEGAAWKTLWTPERRWMSGAVKAKLAEFEAGGGKVASGSAALAVAGLSPDAIVGADAKGRAPGGWRGGEEQAEWIHRRAADGSGDWYYVAPNGEEGYEGEISFRAEGRAEVWDPADGTRRPAEVVAAGGGRTTVRLSLAEAQGVFVVFDRSGAAASAAARQPRAGKQVALGAWEVRFPSGWGLPATLAIDRLASWTELPVGDEGRHFSGTAVYAAEFDFPSKPAAGAGLILDLGRVETVAAVKVNGREVRTLWAEPYRCEIPAAALKEGANALEVAVSSTWRNRLAYDSALPAEERKTWTHAAPAKGTAPQPAGLLGPVSLAVAE